MTESHEAAPAPEPAGGGAEGSQELGPHSLKMLMGGVGLLMRLFILKPTGMISALAFPETGGGGGGGAGETHH